MTNVLDNLTDKQRAKRLKVFRDEYAMHMMWIAQLKEGRKVFADLKRSTKNPEIRLQCDNARQAMLEDLDSMKDNLQDLFQEARARGVRISELKV